QYYIDLVKNTHTLKTFLISLKQIQDDYSDGNYSDMIDFVSASTQKLTEIAMKRAGSDFKHAGMISEEVKKKLEEESKRENKNLTGIDTGYKRLNKLTHGWQRGDLIILAARPSVGKTAFALNLCLNAARQDDNAVALFSCEMSSDIIMRRILSAVSKVENDHINTGFMDSREKAKLGAAVNAMKEIKFFIDDTPRIKLGELVAKARKLKNECPTLSLIVIDYLGLIQTEQKFDSTSKEIGLVTATLKELARTLNVPVIALAQLNRDVEKNDNHKPMLSNLRDSGSIEQDADIVMLMYRADYYKQIGHDDAQDGKPGSMANNLQQEVEKNKGNNKDDISTVTINVAKNRNGQIGPCTLLFSKAYSLFDNPTDDFAKQHGEFDE
ncbi:MAG: AAA family ATPase, partial [Bacilli bacterium]|nr:AAA family ATPase [Bacilli bacterium]